MIIIQNKIASVEESLKPVKMDEYDAGPTMTTTLPSGNPALVANIDMNRYLCVTSVPKYFNKVYVYLVDESYPIDHEEYRGYASSYSPADERKAVAQFMSMAKYIDPKDFDIDVVARKYRMKRL